MPGRSDRRKGRGFQGCLCTMNTLWFFLLLLVSLMLTQMREYRHSISLSPWNIFPAGDWYRLCRSAGIWAIVRPSPAPASTKLMLFHIIFDFICSMPWEVSTLFGPSRSYLCILFWTSRGIIPVRTVGSFLCSWEHRWVCSKLQIGIRESINPRWLWFIKLRAIPRVQLLEVFTFWVLAEGSQTMKTG